MQMAIELGSDASNAIEAVGLEKSFGKETALAGVTLRLREGEILGLLGPNGAGKTTFVRAIMGRVAPDSGTLMLFGKSLLPSSAALRAEVGWVPQDLALYPNLTARENLVTFGRYQAMAAPELNSAIEECLSWAALTERSSEPVNNFSGGMKRRLNMAIGVVHCPRVLLLDEPTVGVDPQSRERMYTMIEELRAQGSSILYTTHYMEEAERLCDRIAIIDHGRVIAVGTSDDLIRETLGTARETEIECGRLTPELESYLRARHAVIEGNVVRSPINNSGADLMALLDEFRRAGVPIRNLQVKIPSLEGVFLHLTGRGLRE